MIDKTQPYNALIISTVDYALPAIAGLLPQTDKSRLGLDAFFRNAKWHGLCHSDFFIFQFIDSVVNRLIKQVQFSRHCSNPFPGFRVRVGSLSMVRLMVMLVCYTHTKTNLHKLCCCMLVMLCRFLTKKKIYVLMY